MTSHGISLPVSAGGRRSSSALGRAVVAAALHDADPVGSRAAAAETGWRRHYLLHFRRLLEAGLVSRAAWLEVASSGLAAAHRSMTVVDGEHELPLDALLELPAAGPLGTVTVRGTKPPAGELVVPYRGDRLRGDALRERLAAWTRDGVLEPSAADAVGEVMDHPEWLPLPGRTVAVLGAGAEMGPLRTLLGWGATVAAVDLPNPAVWERVLQFARDGAGTLLVPERGGVTGTDLLAEVPAVADWLLCGDAGGGRLVLGNYLYADGSAHVRVTMAADILARRLQRARPDLALAFLATPTDAFAVPVEAVRHATEAYRNRSATATVLGRPLRWASRGALLSRAYPPDADPGICDALVPAQGPNYALAKRLQRWRAAVARDAGSTVSFHVAPSSRTRSVVKNRALASAFAGAHRFGVEVFDPSTANVLMAALLARDLNVEPVVREHPWQDEAAEAVHGGLWRTPYAPRSALGIAALLGFATSR